MEWEVCLSRTWIDLGLFEPSLIATTKKSAKGESVCSRTFRPWRLVAPGFFLCRCRPPSPDAGGFDERLAQNTAGYSFAFHRRGSLGFRLHSRGTPLPGIAARGAGPGEFPSQPADLSRRSPDLPLCRWP